MSDKIPWPNDAVMIVAPCPHDAIIDPAKETFLTACRRCGESVQPRVESVTYAEAIERKLGTGRTVRFFCIRCAALHDVREIDILSDLRGT